MPASHAAAWYWLIIYMCIGCATIFLSLSIVYGFHRQRFIGPLLLCIIGCIFATGAVALVEDIHEFYPLCRGMGGGYSLCRGYGALPWEEANVVSRAALLQDRHFVLTSIAISTGGFTLFLWIVSHIARYWRTR
jgi:hypothetical protein